MNFRNRKSTYFATSILATSIMTIAVDAQAANQLQQVSATQTSANTTQLKLNFQGAAVMPTAYQTTNPNRLILDFNQVDSNIARSTAINTGVVDTVTSLNNGAMTRLVVDLKNSATYAVRKDGSNLVFDIMSNVATPIQSAAPNNNMVVQVNPLLNQANSSTNRSNVYEGVSAVNYSGNASGGGNIDVVLTNEAIPVDVQRQGNKLLIRLGARVPRHLLRHMETKGLVHSIDANNQGNNGVITINMSGDYEYQAYQTGAQLHISVSKPKMLREPTIEEKVYKGERMSMEFQDLPVRTILYAISEFTNMNIVASDNVQGNMTLLLDNVPWDQALDIVLKSKNLGKRVNGNVILVAPAQELSDQEIKELEAKKKTQTLAPLRTEYIRLSYAKAQEVFNLLKQAETLRNRSGENGTSDLGLLSERGSVIVDTRTNTLAVTDISDSIDKIRAFIDKIDIPVKQVMIEARIVSASDTFSKELGVSWGLLSSRKDLAIGGSQQTLWDLRAPRTGNANNGAGAITVTRPDNLSVNLGATNPAGRIAFGILSMSDAILDLELSAMQADNRGEIISTPKVLTADKQTARISSGTQIAYQEASASGATTTSFKEAALVLEATPNITPDGKIGLQLNIKNGTPTTAVNGAVAIQEDSIQTNVVIEDGQTVVLGGVFKNTVGNTTKKVPFLGDLPYVGRLFKNDSKVNNKQELLIFITPKLVNDNVNRIN